MGLGDSFIVNTFMFCTDHGREFCSVCCCDYRMGNNYLIELDDAILERFEELWVNVDDRPALNAYALGAKKVPQNKKIVNPNRDDSDDDEDIYKCSKHGTVDCGDCFDWYKLILKSAEVLTRLRGDTDLMGSGSGSKSSSRKVSVLASTSSTASSPPKKNASSSASSAKPKMDVNDVD